MQAETPPLPHPPSPHSSPAQGVRAGLVLRQLDANWSHWEEGTSIEKMLPPDWPVHIVLIGDGYGKAGLTLCGTTPELLLVLGSIRKQTEKAPRSKPAASTSLSMASSSAPASGSRLRNPVGTSLSDSLGCGSGSGNKLLSPKVAFVPGVLPQQQKAWLEQRGFGVSLSAQAACQLQRTEHPAAKMSLSPSAEPVDIP